MDQNIATLRVKACGISDIGLARSNNEDYFLIDEEAKLFILTDGMGGHNAGEIAAEEAAIVTKEKIYDLLIHSPPPTFDHAILSLKEAIVHANQHVYQRAKSHISLKGMGTTLCSLLFHDNQVLFAHVGDSRIYRFRSKLTLLTRDHSLRTKALGMEESKHLLANPKWGRNILTRSIGTSSKVAPEIGWEEARPDDIYCLCSDGLSDYVSEEAIRAILERDSNLQNACDALIQLAKKNGGRDNITIILVKFFLDDSL